MSDIMSNFCVIVKKNGTRRCRKFEIIKLLVVVTGVKPRKRHVRRQSSEQHRQQC